ncbi:MAG: NAD(P)-dependent oxidoreductase [Actinomycetota bacterium]
MRVITQLGATSVDRDLVVAAFPDVELIDFTSGDPPDVQADAFFGGYMGWDDILRWLDASGVRWVQLSGTGIDNVPAAVFDGRVVTCARGASATPISEWVMTAILSAAKRFPDVFLGEPPKWWNFPVPPLASMHGATLGLVGLGGIGTAIAERARPFGTRIKALRRTDAPSPIPGVEIVRTLEELVSDTDHLVLCAPGTERTRGMIDAAVLAAVKPGLHLVNIARGSLIDQDALRAALDEGRVALATLDTVTPEPLPAGHWMYSHPSVRLSAHVSWYSPALQRAAVEIFVDNLGRFQRGEPLLHVVDTDEGY